MCVFVNLCIYVCVCVCVCVFLCVSMGWEHVQGSCGQAFTWQRPSLQESKSRSSVLERKLEVRKETASVDRHECRQAFQEAGLERKERDCRSR